MRLIDADLLKGQMEPVCMGIMAGTESYGAPLKTIDNAPTVDAVEVVRCKDCKYAHLTYQKSCKYCDMWKDDDDFFLRLYLPPDFYCAYGERREDERK